MIEGISPKPAIKSGQTPAPPPMPPSADVPGAEHFEYLSASSARTELWLAEIYGELQRHRPSKTLSVTVKDVEISFTSMTVLLVTVALASIPALIILGIIGFFVIMVFGGLLRAL